MGPVDEHYRCLKIYMSTTRSVLISDAIECIPRYIPILEAGIDDHMRKTANSLVHLLLNKIPAIPALKLEPSRDALI